MALNTIYNGIDSKVFEKVKDLEKASEVWVRLEEIYEGTTMVKSAKMYMLKNQLTNFKMKDDETISEMFYRMQVIINDLKSLGEKTKDEDFCHKFLMCLPKRFKTLCTILFRGGLKGVSPNEVLGDVMTEDQYNSDGEEVLKEEDKKNKSVAFKAGASSSKNKSKGKAKKDESSDDEGSNDDRDDEALALFVHKFGKMMKKKGYGARKRRDHFKNKEHVRLCYKCKSPDHVVTDCPYNSDNEENKKKKNKKEKKEKKITFKKKKKGGSYVVTLDSDASSDDDDSSDDERKTSKKKALTSIAINNKPSLFDTPLCFMAKGPKVKYDESGNKSESENENDSNNDDEFTNEKLMDMLEQADSLISTKSKKCKELSKKLKALEQSFDELNATHERLVEAYEKLGKAHTKLEKAHSLLLNENKEKFFIHHHHYLYLYY
ncbi:uncharacterized protein [Miscanthus floridulus]|uniref:uncharacterized protein n=1 Tax=Miscanthus floridulus TaxID=154761 RepID=UPI0034593081